MDLCQLVVFLLGLFCRYEPATYGSCGMCCSAVTQSGPKYQHHHRLLQSTKLRGTQQNPFPNTKAVQMFQRGVNFVPLRHLRFFAKVKKEIEFPKRQNDVGFKKDPSTSNFFPCIKFASKLGHVASNELQMNKQHPTCLEVKMNLQEGWGAAQHGGSILASHPADLGLIPRVPKKNFRGKLSMLLRLINSAG